MINAAQRERWFEKFYASALKFPEVRPLPREWAKSMSLIAEQFLDIDESEEIR